MTDTLTVAPVDGMIDGEHVWDTTVKVVTKTSSRRSFTILSLSHEGFRVVLNQNNVLKSKTTVVIRKVSSLIEV